MASFGPTPAIVPAEETPALPPAKKQRKAKAATPVVEKKKRARTAFLFYSNANRAAVRELRPGCKITEAAVVLGEQWKALSDAEKAPYHKLAAEDKARILAENNQPAAVVAEPVAAEPVAAEPVAAQPVVAEPVAKPAEEPPAAVIAEPLKGKKRTVKK
jgi:hypothetical protein